MQNNRLTHSVLKKYVCFLLTVGILIAAFGAEQFNNNNDKQFSDTSRNLIQAVIGMEPVAGIIEVPVQLRLSSVTRQNNRWQNPLRHYFFVVSFLCLTVSARTYVMNIRKCRSDVSSNERIIQFIHDQDGRK